jgi:hypothetical protein
MYHLVDKFACRAATGILETLATTACSKRHGRRRAAASTTSRLSCPRLEPAAAHRLAGMPTKRLIGRHPEEEPMSENEPPRSREHLAYWLTVIYRGDPAAAGFRRYLEANLSQEPPGRHYPDGCCPKFVNAG